jgi:hypothetical protein
MPNSWGYPKQVQEWVPETHNPSLTKQVAKELEITINYYKQG